MSELKQVMVDAAIAASKLILEIYRKGTEAQEKSDGSPVTEADQKGEEAILAILSERCGEIPVIAEESVAGGAIPKAHPKFFLVDPLDGTKEFVKATDQFTVNIALIEDGVPTMGVVTVPAQNKLYVGEVGEGATLQEFDFATGEAKGEPQAIAVRAKPASGGTAMMSASHGSDETTAMLEKLGVTDIMPAGSSLKFCFIAEGKADIYPRLGRTMEWDTGAAHAVLRAAGGEVYVFDNQERGGPLTYGKEERAFDNPHFLAVGQE